MKWITALLALLFFSLGGVTANATSMYSWTDEKGVTHLSNKIPPENAKDIKEFEMPGRVEKPIEKEPEKGIQDKPEKKDEGGKHSQMEKTKTEAEDFQKI